MRADNAAVTTAGATEGIFTGMQALINPGDEVYLFLFFLLLLFLRNRHNAQHRVSESAHAG
jgi:hypothetical protein